MKKEMKEDLAKWRDIPCSWLVRLNIIKVSVPLNLIYGVNIIPIQILAMFHRYQARWRNWNTQDNLQKKNKVRMTLPDKSHYLISRFNKAKVIKTVWYCQKERNTYKWNRRDSKWDRIDRPEMPHTSVVNWFLTKAQR